VLFCALLWQVTRTSRHTILVLVVAAAGLGTLAVPPIPQDPAYHAFADGRPMLDIPNALNVLSNIPFLAAGWFGLLALRRCGPRMEPWRRRAYVALFAGTALTAIGSSYYHLAPDNARLVWDRLPMTLGFMGLLTAMLAERVDARAARALLLPLLALGGFSVAFWGWSEARGAGDLRLYGFIQYGSLVIVFLLLAFYRSGLPGTAYLVAGLGAYAAAKIFEALDVPIYALGHAVSGHTLKHVAAAAGLGCVAWMLRHRARAGAC
jgi:predicted membrane channel-forming protein YqfA (hemolysin III family)